MAERDAFAAGQRIERGKAAGDVGWDGGRRRQIAACLHNPRAMFAFERRDRLVEPVRLLWFSVFPHPDVEFRTIVLSMSRWEGEKMQFWARSYICADKPRKDSAQTIMRNQCDLFDDRYITALHFTLGKFLRPKSLIKSFD